MSRLGLLGGLLLAAGLVRIAYLSEYVTKLPFVYGPLGDSLVYLQQARDVSMGRLGSPALLAFSPLYGYALAVLTPGEASLLPLIMQMAAGLVSIALMHRFSKELFGTRSAHASALLMVGYSTLLFLETKLLSETLALTLFLTGMVLYISPAFRRGAAVSTLAAGVVVGLSVLARASMVFCIPCFVLCALPPWHSEDAPLRTRAKRALLFALGALCVLGANGAVNHHYSGAFVPVIMVSRTLETASKVEWTGDFDAFATHGKQASPFDVVEQAVVRLREGPSEEPSLMARVRSLDLMNILRGIPGKWMLTFSNRESFQEYGFRGERHHLTTLKLLPVSFGSLVLLAVFGAGLAWRGGRLLELLPLLPPLLGTLATTALYHPSSRYRLALVATLLPLAGFALVAVWQLRPAVARMVCGGAMFVSVAVATVDHFVAGRGNVPAWHFELALSSYMAGETDGARTHALQTLRTTPPSTPLHARAKQLLRVVGSEAGAPTGSGRPLLPPDL